MKLLHLFLVALFMTLCMSFSFGQNTPISKEIKIAFEGVWVAERKYYNTRLKISFDDQTNDVYIIDIGTAEAPPVQLLGHISGKKIIVLPRLYVNDHCLLEIKESRLLFRTQPTIWNADNKAQPPGSYWGITLFKREKKSIGQ